MARPREWDRAELLEKLIQYVDSSEIPILAEFAHEHGVLRQRMYEWPELEDAIKACVQKKEMALEKKALNGSVNCTMAIFSLKQLGWTDKNEQTHKGDKANPIMISNTDSQL
jgi:hypothetical protein